VTTRATRAAAPPAPSALRQFKLMIGLWWLFVRRRPTRIGDAPKLSGPPVFLLIGLVSTGYMALLAWLTVLRNVRRDAGLFTWHMLGVLVLGLAAGISAGARRLQLRGTRDDAFLEGLPLTTPARLGLQFSDALPFAALALVVPLAALHALGSLTPWAVSPATASLLAFVACFVVGQSAIAWARALGPTWTPRWCGYLGVALSAVGLGVIFMPLGEVWIGAANNPLARLARLWLGPHTSRILVYGALSLIVVLAYGALRVAERIGFDQLEPPIRAPKVRKRTRGRFALERSMMWRQGGQPLFVLFSVVLVGAASVFFSRPPSALPPMMLRTVAGFVMYLGALQTIALAGRAARGDLMARSFLAALPLSPHQVLDGKVRALRMLLLPIFLLLALLLSVSVWYADYAQSYRLLLSLLCLFFVVSGAVSVAFLATGIGVPVTSGARASSAFSTTILMLPLFATVLAPNGWVATTAFIAVAAVSWESRRAARMSVRWLDDPADDVERETTVWRALLAMNGFLAVQALSDRSLRLFELAAGYRVTLALGGAALLLALLTWRNEARLGRPRFLPARAWHWPLGLLAGVGSGLLAHALARHVLPELEPAGPAAVGGELIALGITLLVVTPVAEEYFFRGWLQRAIAQDLPANRTRWAFAIGAGAFALSHVGSYGAPQLVLGLLAGGLYARSGGLGPSILAHAAHNALVLSLA
jgi:membrane protease YdiL (CAAX protease family)